MKDHGPWSSRELLGAGPHSRDTGQIGVGMGERRCCSSWVRLDNSLACVSTQNPKSLNGSGEMIPTSPVGTYTGNSMVNVHALECPCPTPTPQRLSSKQDGYRLLHESHPWPHPRRQASCSPPPRGLLSAEPSFLPPFLCPLFWYPLPASPCVPGVSPCVPCSTMGHMGS